MRSGWARCNVFVPAALPKLSDEALRRMLVEYRETLSDFNKSKALSDSRARQELLDAVGIIETELRERHKTPVAM